MHFVKEGSGVCVQETCEVFSVHPDVEAEISGPVTGDIAFMPSGVEAEESGTNNKISITFSLDCEMPLIEFLQKVSISRGICVRQILWLRDRLIEELMVPSEKEENALQSLRAAGYVFLRWGMRVPEEVLPGCYILPVIGDTPMYRLYTSANNPIHNTEKPMFAGVGVTPPGLSLDGLCKYLSSRGVEGGVLELLTTIDAYYRRTLEPEKFRIGIRMFSVLTACRALKEMTVKYYSVLRNAESYLSGIDWVVKFYKLYGRYNPVMISWNQTGSNTPIVVCRELFAKRWVWGNTNIPADVAITVHYSNERTGRKEHRFWESV